MRKHYFMFLLLGLIFVLHACGQKQANNNPQILAGYSGHLDDLDQVGDLPYYLINVRKDESYDICMPAYLLNKWPGVKTELEAAVNLWGHYIGRSIQVQFKVVDMPGPMTNESPNDTRTRYYRSCGPETDLVFGEAYIVGGGVGQTNGWTTSNSFQHALFLKKSAANEANLQWHTLEQVTGVKRSAQELLELMKRRDQRQYLFKPNTILSLRIITHEVGHLWGLCDQYVVNDQELTNCDPKHASKQGEGQTIIFNKSLKNEQRIVLVEKSIMAQAKRWVNDLYLSDDDIEGIRSFGDRPKFLYDWPSKAQFMQIEVPKLKLKSVDYAGINSVKVTDGNVTFRIALVTNTPIRYALSLRNVENQLWINTQTDVYTKPVETQLDFTIPNRNNLIFDKVVLHVQPFDQQGDIGAPLMIERDFADLK